MNGWELHLPPDSFELAGTEGGEEKVRGRVGCHKLSRAGSYYHLARLPVVLHPSRGHSSLPAPRPTGIIINIDTSRGTMIADKLDLLEAESIWILLEHCNKSNT